VFRYRPEKTDDGFDGEGEGSFTVCSFWLVSALVAIGELDSARTHCEKLIGAASSLGLYAEELDPTTERHLGNFPQALTHLALINAIMSVISGEAREGEATKGNQQSWWNAGKVNNANTIAAKEIWTESTGSVEIIRSDYPLQ